MTKSTSVYKRKKDLILKKIHDTFLVIDTQSDNYFELNETGFTILRFLNKKRSIKNIIKKINQEFETSNRKIGKDISSFLQENITKGLIKEY